MHNESYMMIKNKNTERFLLMKQVSDTYNAITSKTFNFMM